MRPTSSKDAPETISWSMNQLRFFSSSGEIAWTSSNTSCTLRSLVEAVSESELRENGRNNAAWPESSGNQSPVIAAAFDAVEQSTDAFEDAGVAGSASERWIRCLSTRLRILLETKPQRWLLPRIEVRTRRKDR